MSIVEQFNKAIERELVKLPKDQAERLDQAMSQFDELVKAGIVQPDRYNLEPISTIPKACHLLAYKETNNIPAS